MPSEKRQRQDQGRLLRLEEQRTAQQHARRRGTTRNVVGAVIVVAVIGLVIALVSGGGDKEDDVATDDSTTTSIEGSVEVIYPGEGEAITGETPCPEADGSSKRTTSFSQLPPTCIDPAKTYTATIATSEGDITVALDAKAAPVAVNSFVVLSRYHYYDEVPFHRIIPGFMNQTGDAVGPPTKLGYTLPDELPTGTHPYPTGTLAMASSGQPDSASSQFFITVEGGEQRLQPTYTAFGHVTAGQDVVDAINQLGDAASDGTPITKLVTITSVTLTES